MKVARTNSFKRDWRGLPENIKKRAERALELLVVDLHYPSLRAKKIEGTKDIWEASVTKSYRFTFQITRNTYLVRRIGTHKVLKKP